MDVRYNGQMIDPGGNVRAGFNATKVIKINAQGHFLK